MILAGAQCTPLLPPAEETTTENRAIPAGPAFIAGSGQFLLLEDSAVVVADASEEELYRIDALHPSGAAWTPGQDAIVWCEQQEGVDIAEGSSAELPYVLKRLTIGDGTVEPVHWTRDPMSDLAFSVGARYLAYIQDGSLYVLEMDSGTVQRVAEHAVGYEWSPQLQAMIVQTKNATQYIDIGPDGSPGTAVELGEGRILGAAAFMSRNLAAGLFQTDERISLVQIDLRNGERTEIVEWRSFVSEEGETGEGGGGETPVPSYQYQISIAPELETAILAETESVGGEPETTTASIVSLPHRQKAYLKTGGTPVGWLDDTTAVVANPEDDGIVNSRYTLVTVDTVTQNEQTLRTVSSIPIFP